MLTIKCDMCQHPLEEMGALLFSPPNGTPYPQSNTIKFHLCVHCYKKVMNMLYGPLQPTVDCFVDKLKQAKIDTGCSTDGHGNQIKPEVSVVECTICPACNGRGKRMKFGGVFYNETCQYCRGKGQIIK